MNPYLVVPLLAAVSCAALAATAFALGPKQHATKLACLLMLVSAWWASCEVLWNAADSAAAALWLCRAASASWILIPPITIHLILQVTQRKPARMRSLLPAIYAGCALFIPLSWATPWMVEGMNEVSWGYAMVPGPVFPISMLLGASGISAAIVGWVRSYRASSASLDHAAGPVVTVCILVPFIVSAAIDGLLPSIGVQWPRIGTLCNAMIGAVVIWALVRFGFVGYSPESFSSRMLQTMPDGVSLTSLNGRIRAANEKLASLLGVPTNRIEGIPLSEHLSHDFFEPPQDVREVECELTSVTGRSIPVSVCAAPLIENGGVKGLVLIVRDTREVASLRASLALSGRLAAVGELAAGIAHEINNPLAFVRSNLGHLRREWEVTARDLEKDGAVERFERALSEWEELIDESLEGVDRAVTIVRDVREFARMGGDEWVLRDLNELLEQVLRMAAPQFGPSVRIERYLEELPPLPCAPERMLQLFLNIVVNAAHAIGDDGTLKVSTLADDDSVVATIEDDGHGIPADQLDRIFDPFFTTKGAGVGTGLGLSISHEIVRGHGGEMRVDSQPGKGTTFSVRLPVRDRAAA